MTRFRDLRSQRPVKGRRFSDKPRRCLWCGRAFGRRLKPTREHLRPRSAGGGGGANLAAACAPCNNARGSDMEWRPFGTPVDDLPDSQAKHLHRLRVGFWEVR